MNIQNKDDKSRIAWVDIKGTKHEYPSSAIKNHSISKKNASNSNCAKIPSKMLEQNQYNSIKSGDTLSDMNSCNRMDIDMKVWNKLTELNSRLMYLTLMMKKEIKQLSEKDNQLSQTLQDKQNSLDQLSSNLQQTGDQMKLDMPTITGEYEDRKSQLISNKTHFMLWIILLIFIMVVLGHTLFNKANNLASIIIIIVSSILIYNGVIWLWKNYNYQFF